MIKVSKFLSSALVLACLLCTSLASAQSASEDKAAPSAEDMAAARGEYARGQQLFRDGDYGGAEKAFQEAYRIVPNPIVLLSVAECQVRAERFTDAVLSLSRYLEDRPDAPDRAQVEAQMAKLKERPGTLVVTSEPPGATIVVDGDNTGKVTPAEVELQSGDHTIVLKAPGYADAERPTTILIGGRHELDVQLSALQVAAPEPAVDPNAGVEADADDASRTRKAVWVAASVAGAGLVAGTVLGALALKNKRDFDDNPTEAIADKGERLALFADVGFGVAIAAGVTAIVLYVTEDDEAASEQSFSVAPSVGPRAAGLVSNLRF